MINPGVLEYMRIRWKLVLPLLGLVVFGVLTESAFRIERVTPHISHRYFWWSTIRLDPDPLNRRRPACCGNGEGNSRAWDLLRNTWVYAGSIPKWFMVSALPAFVAGVAIVHGLGRLGVNEVCSFLISMPFFVFAWYYFVGWLIDRWKSRRMQKA